MLARKLGQVSRLGQLLDPAADRLFIFATLIGLAVRGIIPWWLLAVVVGRDVMLLVLGIVLANFGYGPIPVHHLGKMATFCLLFALPLFMVGAGVPGGGGGRGRSAGHSRSGVRSCTGGPAVFTCVEARRIIGISGEDVAPRIGYAGTPREEHDG